MTAIRRVRVGVFACAFIVAPACAGHTPPVNPDALIGRWELRGKWTSDNVSSMLDLFPGGWYSQTLVATSKLRFDYDGKQLVLIPLDAAGKPRAGERATLDVVFRGDTLIGTSGQDTVRMIRTEGNLSSRGILGRWLTTNAEGKGVIEDFGFDGFLHIQTTITGEVGRYSVFSGDIEWDPRIPQRSKHKTRFSLKENKLLLGKGDTQDELVRLR